MKNNMLQKNDDGVFHIYEKLKEPLSRWAFFLVFPPQWSTGHPFVIPSFLEKRVPSPLDILVGGWFNGLV